MFCSILVSALAFHGPSAPLRRSTVQMQAGKKSAAVESPYSEALGVIAPTGFFDPLGLSKDIDEETFDQYRTAELKHGRVAQLAVIGYIVPEIYRFPGEIAPGITFASIPNGVAAIDAIPALGWAQMIFLIGASAEALCTPLALCLHTCLILLSFFSRCASIRLLGSLRLGAVDYWGFLGDFDIGKPDLDEEELEKRQLNELQHGRLAMLAVLELLRHDSQNTVKPMFDGLDHLITGLPFLYQ